LVGINGLTEFLGGQKMMGVTCHENGERPNARKPRKLAGFQGVEREWNIF
jgi:hypothetical protein